VIGLMFLVAALVYLLITVLVTWLAVRAARRRGIAGWKWGLPALLVMYLLVFWDWIPTALLHRHYCSEEAGLTVYKSAEVWKKENPGAVQALAREESINWHANESGEMTYPINDRLVFETVHEKLPLSISIEMYRIVDKNNDQILVEKKDVTAGTQAIGLGIRSIRDLKLWFSPYKTCFREDNKVKWLSAGKSFSQLLEEFQNIGSNVNE
jgi:energy-coupling factor transporter transmembrane protein EcfT